MTKSTFHHGDLFKALIREALAVVEIEGADALSIRRLAQVLGVSHAAPSRHFSDRNALLAAVAAQGFEDLILAYQAALAGPGDGWSRLVAFNQAFFDFAFARRNLHQLMFESDLLNAAHPPAILTTPAAKAYRLLFDAIQGAYPTADQAEIRKRALLMVSTSHGFLMLDRVGRFRPFMIEPLGRDDMIDTVKRAAIGDGSYM